MVIDFVRKFTNRKKLKNTYDLPIYCTRTVVFWGGGFLGELSPGGVVCRGGLCLLCLALHIFSFFFVSVSTKLPKTVSAIVINFHNISAIVLESKLNLNLNIELNFVQPGPKSRSLGQKSHKGLVTPPSEC